MKTTASPKYLELSQKIASRIHAGCWPDLRMPSLRELAGEFSVSVVTASRAIQVLRDKGMIARADRSGCYLAAPDDVAHSERWGLCLRVTPGALQGAAGSITRVGFEAVARDGIISIYEDFNLRLGSTHRDIQRQVRAALNAGVRGIFLLPSRLDDENTRLDEMFLAACDADKLPVVLFDRNLRGHWRRWERDLVCLDDLEGAARCTRHLLDLGRRRFPMVVASPCSSHHDRVAGYLQALHSAVADNEYKGLTFAPQVLRVPQGLVSKQVDRWLADRLAKLKADAVFCFQDSLAVGVILELLSRGVHVPRDVAVVGFENLPIGDLFTIGVTTYDYPSEGMARAGLDVMRRRLDWPLGPPIKVSVPGELIVRESTNGPRPPVKGSRNGHVTRAGSRATPAR